MIFRFRAVILLATQGHGHVKAMPGQKEQGRCTAIKIEIGIRPPQTQLIHDWN